MEEKIVEVNGIVGPSYTNGFFRFRYNQQPIPNYIGDHHGSLKMFGNGASQSQLVKCEYNLNKPENLPRLFF